MKSAIYIITVLAFFWVVSEIVTRFEANSRKDAENFCSYRKGHECQVLAKTHGILTEYYVIYKNDSGEFVTVTEF